MRTVLMLSFLFAAVQAGAQAGTVSGTVVDEDGTPLEKVSVRLQAFGDSSLVSFILTDKAGAFSYGTIPYGRYKVAFSYAGLQPLVVDSLHVRAERPLFYLGEIMLKPKTSSSLQEVIIYAEKPLIQSKDGNIIFNASESALSQGSNAGDLLTQVPLVTKDPNGKLLVRGKEPKVLIDDKPVELNLQQLQDLLESLPGSSVEKIEVMTNPPPQYAGEQGGVINIVTKKGAVGIGVRVTLHAGTRGETGGNGSFNFRKRGLSVNANAGYTVGRFAGSGYSVRQNVYADSVNFFNTSNEYVNQSRRPNVRVAADYEPGKRHSLNAVLQYNANDFDNRSATLFQNINRFEQLYRLSRRRVSSGGTSYSPNASLTYAFKTARPGETFRLFGTYHYSDNDNGRVFYQQFLNPDYSFTIGNDSTQQQLTANLTKGYTVRASYDVPLADKKTSLSAGGYYSQSLSDVDVQALYARKTDGRLLPQDLLSNAFLFRQRITNFRASAKRLLQKSFSVSAGLAVEQTVIRFDLQKAGTDTLNRYWNYLPFANVNKSWPSNLNLSFSYRRTLRRPGINELNPTRDFSDPYNVRAGNPSLAASPAHTLDLVAGKTKGVMYANLGLGYNSVEAIFNPIRTLLPNGTTETVWQNISGRKEYEVSGWAGYTFKRKLRLNASANYTYNAYSDYDKKSRRFRNGASLTSNLNTNYVYKELYTATGSFTYNRFAAPQGTVRSTVSMNIGVQAKVFKKRMIVTLNAIDPFIQQRARTFTYGERFILENFNGTQTRNYRVSISYGLSKTVRSVPVKKATGSVKPKGQKR